MYIDLFKKTLDLLGEQTKENIMAALAKVNSVFISELDIDNMDEDTVISEELQNNALNFTTYFLENYGLDTMDLRELVFNGEVSIIEFTNVILANSVTDRVLDYANTHMTKKIQFNLDRLKNQIKNLLDEYSDVYIECYGDFKFEQDESVTMSTELEVYDIDEELENLFKIALFSETSSCFIQCGDDDETVTVYGLKFTNKNWSIISIDELEEIMNENWIEEQKAYGYNIVKFEEFQEKF